MKDQPFYMVYLQDEDSPTYKHDSLESAEKEAKRLSKSFRKKAFVLCSLKSFELIEFIINDCRPNEDLPF